MKRQRVDDGAGRDTADDDGGWTTQLKLLSPALQQAMNGREYCTEAQLTPKVMLDRLLALKEIAVVEAADISVQTLPGGIFTVTMGRSENEVHLLKVLIESKQGASRLNREVIGPSRKSGHRAKRGRAGAAENRAGPGGAQNKSDRAGQWGC